MFAKVGMRKMMFCCSMMTGGYDRWTISHRRMLLSRVLYVVCVSKRTGNFRWMGNGTIQKLTALKAQLSLTRCE